VIFNVSAVATIKVQCYSPSRFVAEGALARTNIGFDEPLFNITITLNEITAQ